MKFRDSIYKNLNTYTEGDFPSRIRFHTLIDSATKGRDRLLGYRTLHTFRIKGTLSRIYFNVDGDFKVLYGEEFE